MPPATYSTRNLKTLKKGEAKTVKLYYCKLIIYSCNYNYFLNDRVDSPYRHTSML